MRALYLLAAYHAVQCTAAPYPSDTIDAGHHVIWSYPGATIPQAIYNATTAGKVGGLIFFGENVKNVPDLPQQIAALQAAYKNSKAYRGYPLLMTTDQEGGYVNRLPGGPTASAKQIGQSSNPAAAAASAGANVATVFGKYNVNSDLAPVLDVYRQPGDFIDEFERSYGNTSGLVSTCIGPWLSSLQSAGYPATAKHFPGLGAASTNDNTDVKPVTITLSLSELRNVDMAPYKTAIKDGIKMVMASWAIYPALDSKYPSGLSRKWIQQELRGRLGFRGVTITDALEAGSLAAFGDTSARAILASTAGMDILLAASRNVTQGEQAYDALVAGLKSGKLDREQFSDSTKRIVRLRQSLPA